jgi:hypothetical protein
VTVVITDELSGKPLNRNLPASLWCPNIPGPTVIGVGCNFPTPGITARVTDTSLGPDICGDGTGFIPGGQVDIVYLNVPGSSGPLAAVVNPVPDIYGNFSYFDQSLNRFRELGIICSDAELNGNVTVQATDLTLFRTATAMFPIKFLCVNAPFIPPSFGGGCLP